LELHARCAENRELPVELTVVLVPGPDARGFTAFFRDLTDRDEAEAARRSRIEQTLLQHSTLLKLASRPPSDFISALREILRASAEMLDVDRVSFWTYRPEPEAIFCEMLFDRARDEYERGVILLASDFPAYFESLRTDSLIAADDAMNDPRTAEFGPSYLAKHGIASMMDIPVWRGGSFIGVLCHETLGEQRTWIAQDQEFASSVGHLIALARAERERQQAEQALRESEQRFRATFEQVAVGIGHLSRDGRWLWTNERLCQITGHSRERLLELNTRHLLDPNHLTAFQTGLQRLLKLELTSLADDYLFVRGDGSTIWVNVTVGLSRDAGGDPLYFVAVLQDISVRKRAEERVLEQANLLDLTHDAIVVRDLDGRVLFWNRGAERLYGISSEEAIGKRERDLLYSDTADFDAARTQALARGEWNGELRQCPRGTSSEIVVDARWTVVKGAGGEPESILAINTDITGRKNLEEQFLRAQRMESIGTLASGVAHDLNNILAPILMSIPMLQGTLPEKTRQSILSSMETSAQRGADIVRQVLTFARGVEGERVLLQPGHLLREMTKIVSETFPKSLTLRSDIPNDLWTVTGDATQLHQVLMNLCVNARDAMPEGGTLTITAENGTLDESSAAMTPGSQPGDYTILIVSDTGKGIPREHLNKIFEPFFTTKEQGKGTGLGLSTTMGIVKSHGGFLTVNTELGRGTTFRIYVPATISARVLEERPPSRTLIKGSGELLLIVDDEVSIRTVTSEILRRNGYEVLLAADGTEALASYAQRGRAIHAVLTDINMPYIDGVGLTRALKRMNPEVKVLASTGHADAERVTELRSLGIAGFLEKPFTAEMLLRTVHGILHPAAANV
jgi:PAS domain S-box-containing protein